MMKQAMVQAMARGDKLALHERLVNYLHAEIDKVQEFEEVLHAVPHCQRAPAVWQRAVHLSGALQALFSLQVAVRRCCAASSDLSPSLQLVSAAKGGEMKPKMWGMQC